MSQAFAPQCCEEEMRAMHHAFVGEVDYHCRICLYDMTLADSVIAARMSTKRKMDALAFEITASVAKMPEMANTNPSCGCEMQDLMMNGCPSAGGGACPSVVKALTVSVPSAVGLATTPDKFEARLHVGTSDCIDCGCAVSSTRYARGDRTCYECARPTPF